MTAGEGAVPGGAPIRGLPLVELLFGGLPLVELLFSNHDVAFSLVVYLVKAGVPCLQGFLARRGSWHATERC